MKNNDITIAIMEVNQSTPLEIRERLNYHSTKLSSIVNSLKSQNVILESFFLCTCNRSLLLFVCKTNDLQKVKKSVLSLFNQWAGMLIPSEYVDFQINQKALAKLVRLSIGVESPVFGENQILGQIKVFYDLSLKNNLSGLILNRIMQRLQSVARKIKEQTSISKGRVSLAGLVISEIEGFIKEEKTKGVQVLIIGWEEIPNTIFKILREMKSDINHISIANRTVEKITVEAEKFTLEKIKSNAKNYDVIITMTSQPGYVIDSKIVKVRATKTLLIDLGVPRNIDPQVVINPLVKLINIDILNQKASKNLAGRKQQIEEVEEYVSVFVNKMMEFIQNYEKYQKIGSRIEKALLKYNTQTIEFLAEKNPEKIKQIQNSYRKRLYRELSIQDTPAA